MSKMTTEQFLSHLGIEVEQEFTWSGDCSTKYRISKSYVLELYSDIFQKWLKSASDIKDLLDEEITPLPKYTLTEDDKKLVSLILPDYKWVARDYNSTLWAFKNKPKKADKGGYYWGLNDGSAIQLFDYLLPFIKWGDIEPTDLEELRKCL